MHAVIIFVLHGCLASSDLQAAFGVLQCTPSISFINLVCNNSSGSDSLHFKADSKPQISQQYNEIGNIRESKSFSNSLQGLFKPIVFFILKYALKINLFSP
jgi:hypothetical protein